MTTLDEYLTGHARPSLLRTARALRRNLEELADRHATSTLDPGGKAAELQGVLDDGRQQALGVRRHVAHEVQEARRLGHALPAHLDERAKPIDDLVQAILDVRGLEDAAALVDALNGQE